MEVFGVAQGKEGVLAGGARVKLALLQRAGQADEGHRDAITEVGRGWFALGGERVSGLWPGGGGVLLVI